ncbi:MAG: nucleotidyl transferase AbiEii/AbiGii toxin family protein [Acidobacteriota bacterium]
MASPKTYATAGAFRRALEERLRNISAAERVDINRLRRQVSFDRLLARLFRDDAAPWVLKGGYALELRFKSARSTIDIDLTVQRVAGAAEGGETVQAIREMLQERASASLNDWFEFVIGLQMMDLTAAPYGGARYSVEARMDGRTFARFHLDAGVGDVILQPLETVECHDWLGFAGIEKPRVWMISREQQLAEKIHAYTLPRSSQNSRVKDLVDLALLVGDDRLDRRRVVDALQLTFARRATHALPASLSAPPEDWEMPFRALAEECGLDLDIAVVFERVRTFVENLIKGGMKP